jgi:hypothetical protein
MTSVCNNKKKATIFIKFKDGRREQVVVEPGGASVDVTQEEPEEQGAGNLMYFVYTNRSGCWGTQVEKDGPFYGPIRGAYVFTDPAGGVRAYLKVSDQAGNQVDLVRYTCSLGSGGETFSIQSIELAPNQDPSPEQPEIKCRIIVKDSKGTEVYNKLDECPIKWNFACDDDCPSQFLRCRASAYPGYRCVPCENFRR